MLLDTSSVVAGAICAASADSSKQSRPAADCVIYQTWCAAVPKIHTACADDGRSNNMRPLCWAQVRSCLWQQQAKLACIRVCNTSILQCLCLIAIAQCAKMMNAAIIQAKCPAGSPTCQRHRTQQTSPGLGHSHAPCGDAASSCVA